MPPTITLDAGQETVAAIRKVILEFAPVQTVASEQGRGDDATDPDGSFLAEFFVPLKPQSEWPKGMTKVQLVDEMNERLNAQFIGIDFNFSQYIQDNIEEAVSGVKGENSIKLFGPDLGELERLSKVDQGRARQGSGRGQSGGVQSAGPAQSQRADRSRQGGALRLLGRRHQHRRAGGGRRPGGDTRL